MLSDARASREQTACVYRCPTRVTCRGTLSFDILGSVKDKEAVSLLSALASEPRLAVFRLLVKRGPQGYTPSELTQRLRVPAPTLSFHLKELTHAGLIASRRDGRNLFYSPDFDRMNSLVGFLTDSCCSLADDKCNESCSPTPVAASRRKTA